MPSAGRLASAGSIPHSLVASAVLRPPARASAAITSSYRISGPWERSPYRGIGARGRSGNSDSAMRVNPSASVAGPRIPRRMPSAVMSTSSGRRLNSVAPSVPSGFTRRSVPLASTSQVSPVSWLVYRPVIGCPPAPRSQSARRRCSYAAVSSLESSRLSSSPPGTVTAGIGPGAGGDAVSSDAPLLSTGALVLGTALSAGCTRSVRVGGSACAVSAAAAAERACASARVIGSPRWAAIWYSRVAR